MPTDLEQQLPRFAKALDREAPTVSVDEILGRGTVAVDVGPPQRPSWDEGSRVAAVSWGDASGRSENGEYDASIELAPMATESPARRRVALRIALAAAAAAVLVLAIGAVARVGGEQDPAGVPPSTVPASPPTVVVDSFSGVWLSIDTDGSFQTMEIVRAGSDGYEVVIRDEAATAACAGGASTMAGVGRLATGTSLVIAQPELTCDDGTTPTVGPAPQAALANFTLDADVETGQLVDEFAVLWQREGSDNVTISPSPAVAPASAPPTSVGMWPQATLEEVEAAQAFADDGDPDYTWQLDAGLAADDYPGTWNRLRDGQVELVDRFLREEMGWEAYIHNAFEGGSDFSLTDQRFLRCAPDRTNPLYSPQPGSDVAGESCAPTLDELTYESVRLDLVQPVRQDDDGIWVVSNWRPTTFVQVDPVVAEAQATGRLEQFLEARVAGNGAEGYVDVYANWLGQEFPLLYAVTSGATYERYEMERVSRPTWPYGGYINFRIRLFAEDGTVVEQVIYSHWDGGASVGIEGGLALGGMTLENGLPVPMVHAQFDGEVTYSSPSESSFEVLGDRFSLLDFTDPALHWSDCRQDPVPDEAAAFAQAIIADPNFETSAPVAARVGGVGALAMDVELSPGGEVCGAFRTDVHRWIHSLEPGKRQRVYLVDVPEGMSMRTLAVTVTAPESRFEEVVQEAEPIIDSIEFHTR